MSVSDKILEGLNQKQREAVTYGEGPILIVAGAGTGKTQVITRRIAWLIAMKRAKPEEILALTFTEKAAAEMEERVDILVPYGYTGVWIGTFHAFGDSVLRENALQLGLVPDLQVLTRPQQIIFFREHLFEFPLSYYRPLGNPTRYIEAMVTLFSRAKDEDVTPEEYLAYAERLKEKAEGGPDDPELEEIATQQMEIARTYKKYQDLLAQHGKIDFGDQITLPLKLFRTHPAVLRQYQDRFRYILVDEFQDTNYTQFQLVKLLASRDQNITVVADDDQSIYKFRGAAISNILGFMDTYLEAKQTVLTENYRSTQVILDAAYRLIGYNNPDRLEFKNNIDKHLKAQVRGGLSIKHLHYDTLFSEAEAAANLIKKKVEREGYDYRDFAILVRANNDADPFLRSLNMADIPWTFSGNEGLYSREEIRLLISFLRTIANFDDSVSLYYLAASEIYQLLARDLTLCMNYASRRNRSLYHVFSRVSEILELDEEISPESKATISRIMKDLEKYAQLAIKQGTGEILYSFIMDTGYLKRLTSLSSLTNEEKVKNIARFFDIIRSVSNVITYDRIPQFTSYLDLLIEVGDNPAVAEADTEADAVNVLTIHKAKGLEFAVVIMVSLVSQRFPCHYRRESISLPDPLIKDILPSGDFHLQEEFLAVFENSWRSEGFLTRQHEEQRLEVGRRTLRSFYQMAEAEKYLPIYVEKEFSFLLENNRITGRWDRVDIRDGEVCIIDFKSSDIRKKEKADKRTRESLQLAIYALAYQKIYGKIPDRVELYFLESGLVGTASLSENDLDQTVEKIGEAAAGIRARVYEAKPAYQACRYCAYEKVCPYTAGKR